MYKVYLLKRHKKGNTIVKQRTTNTHSFEVAKQAFLEVRRIPELEGNNYILLMTKDSVKVNVHLFNAEESNPDFFSLDEITWYDF